MSTWFSKMARVLVVSAIFGVLTGAAIFLVSLHRYPQWWQHRLLSFLQQTLQQPVQIGSVHFFWQGVHLHVLVDHVVIGQDSPIRIQHVDVQWMWRSIILLSPRFSVFVHGVVVPVVHLRTRPLTIGPWQVSTPRAASPLYMRALISLVHQPSIRIEEMQWQLYDDQHLTVPKIIGPILLTSVHTLASEVHFVGPLPSGHSLLIHTNLHSWDPYTPIGFDHATVDITVDRCDLALWQHFLWPSTTTPMVQAGQGSLRVSLHIKQGFLSEMSAQLALQHVVLRNPTVSLDHVRMQATLESEHHLHERLYRVRMHRLSYQVTHHPAVVLQDAQLEGRFSTLNHAWEKCTVRLQQLPLEQLELLLGRWPPWQHSLYHRVQVAGNLPTVTVTYQPGKPHAWFADAQFRNLSWQPYRSVPGFFGVSGTLAGDGSSGQVTIMAPDLSVWAPSIFSHPFHHIQLQAKCFWYRAAHNGVDCSWIHWQDHDVKLSVLGQYNHRRKQVTVIVHTPSLRIAQLKNYLPLVVSPSVRRWYLSALQGEGTLSPAHMMLEIPLFDQHAHVQLSLSTAVHHATVAYDPRWPSITDIQGLLTFHHHELRFFGSGYCEKNTLHDVTVSLHTQAKFPTVSVTGRVEGLLAHYVTFLHHSPLRDTLGSVLHPSHTHVTGPMTLQFQTRVPLTTDQPTAFSGHLHFFDNTVSLYDHLVPCEHIRGTVGVDVPQVGLSQWHLQALCWQKPLQARTAFGSKTYSRLLLKGFVNTQTLASHFLTQPEGISGILPWSAVLESRADSTMLTGSVQGQNLRLQAPLPVIKKATSQEWPLSFFWQHTSQIDRVRAQVAHFIHVIGQRLHQQPWKVGVAVGEHVPAHLPEQGIQIDVQQPVIDVEPWLTFFRTTPSLGAMGTLPPLRIYAYTPHWWYQNWPLGENQITIEQDTAHTYHIVCTGPVIQGAVVVQDAPQPAVQGHFQYVHVAEGMDTPKGSLLTPSAMNTWLQRWPTVAIRVDSLILGHTAWGHCQIIGQQEDGRYLVKKVACTEPKRGHFLIKNDRVYRDGQACTMSTIEASVATWDEIARSCAACSLAGISGGRTQVSAQLFWPDTVVIPALSQLSGSARLSITQGSLFNIKPGALRILGLTSVYSWAQRIMLKFHDVVSPGLAFQSIAATFHLQHEVLSMTDASLYSYMLRVQAQARIFLAKRGFIDANVTAMPDMSGVVAVLPIVTPLSPWVAVLIGLHNVSHHSLDRLLSQRYHVTGFFGQWRVDRAEK